MKRLKNKMRLPVFDFLRWAQENPRLLRLVDLSLGVISIAVGLLQGDTIWIVFGAIFLLAAIFRLAERMNLFLPKLKVPPEDKDV